MEVEKRRSRGSFLNLFDWSGKSRKKLFRNHSELSEDLKKGTQNAENILKTQLSGFPTELDENITSSSTMGCSDYNCAASVNIDGGCETRGPGAVARLMGLDSLPSASTSKLSSSAYFDPPPLRSSHHYHRNAYNLLGDSLSADHINIRKMEKSWNIGDSRRQKVPKRPMERFQNEVLPPRSAKAIPITHHKLLSPIKNPAFICTNNAAYVIDAAAKMMEASPRAYNVDKIPSIGPSSVPLKIKNLKEKLEAAVVKRQLQPSTSSDAKGKPADSSYSKSKLVPTSRGARKSESSNHSRTKERAVSLASQVKRNVQSREIPELKEQSLKLNQFSRNQLPVQQTMQKRTSASKTINVPTYNGQKKNDVTARGKSILKLSATNQPTIRTRSLDDSTGENQSSGKAVIKSRSAQKIFSSSVTNDQKPLSFSKTKSTSQRKRPAGGDVLIKDTIVDNVQIDFDERSKKCNVRTEASKNHHFDDMKQTMDVVSFTFTSPLSSHLNPQVVEMKNRFDSNSFQDNERPCPQALSLSSSELHTIDGGDLSALLDKKLQELTFMIKSSECNLIQEGPSAISKSAWCESVRILPSTISKEHWNFQHDPNVVTLDGLCKESYSSNDNLVLKSNQKWQGTELMEESYYSSHNKIMETGNEVDSLYSGQGSRVVSNFHQTNNSISLVVDPEPSESSLSTLDENMSIVCVSRTCSLTDFKRSTGWELEYIKDILNRLELTGEGFMLCQANDILTPSLFDVLENDGYQFGSRVLFDVVNECLNLRCRFAFPVSDIGWRRWVTLDEKKDVFAEELYRDILGWTRMGELMVDELVGKDMSIGYGRWLDFGVEESEEGVEMECTLLNCLVDELVSDLL